jgi:tetratricopeptide (TPR) repeat protein
MLGLDRDVAIEVERRTAGNPLFAEHLVGDWVHRGILEPGPNGFRLRADENVALPVDLGQVWRERVDDVLAGRDPQEAEGLELAAVLGPEVDPSEWRAVCASAGQSAPEYLVERLIGLRLAVAARDGAEGSWRFVHGMLRESLEERARQGGRLEAHHRSVAAYLETRADRHLRERLGRHLLAAGRVGDALTLLHQVILDAVREYDPARASSVLGLWEDAATRAGLADDDVQRLESWTARAVVAGLAGDVEEQAVWARRVADTSQRLGLGRKEAEGRLQEAAAAMMTGHYDRAHELGMQARAALARSSPDPSYGCRIASLLGWVAVGLGYLDEADRWFTEAIEPPTDDEAFRGLLTVATRRCRWEEAKAWAARSEAAAGTQSPFFRALLRCDQAYIAQSTGDLEGAQRMCREAIDIHVRLGANPAIILIRLGMCLSLEERWAEAQEALEQAIARAAAWEWALIDAHLLLALCKGALGDWTAWDASFAEVDRLLGRIDYGDPDGVTAARRCAALASARGHVVRAFRAEEVARRILADG